MKLFYKTIGLAAVITFAAGNLQAAGGLPNMVTISATALVQGSVSGTKGTVETVNAPTKYTLDTKHLLNFLATATNKTFPIGAKLVGAGGTGNYPVFQVWDKNNALVADVSTILYAIDTPMASGTSVFSGKGDINTQLSSPTTSELQLFTIVYDDGTLKFFFTGVMTNTYTDTVPDKNGSYKETQVHKVSTAAGDGSYQGSPLVITGAFTAAAAGILTTGT